MGFVNSKNYNKVGHRCHWWLKGVFTQNNYLLIVMKLREKLPSFFFLSLRSSNIEIYGMHSTVLLFLEIVGWPMSGCTSSLMRWNWSSWRYWIPSPPLSVSSWFRSGKTIRTHPPSISFSILPGHQDSLLYTHFSRIHPSSISSSIHYGVHLSLYLNISMCDLFLKDLLQRI
jgi:hypothetical protein